jgi:hypothetical protein
MVFLAEMFAGILYSFGLALQNHFSFIARLYLRFLKLFIPVRNRWDEKHPSILSAQPSSFTNNWSSTSAEDEALRGRDIGRKLMFH